MCQRNIQTNFFYDLKHRSNVDEESPVKTCSQTPSGWVDEQKKVDELDNTWPMPRKVMQTLEQIRVDTQRIRENTDATAVDVQKMGSTVHKIDATTERIADTADRTNNMMEETGK